MTTPQPIEFGPWILDAETLVLRIPGERKPLYGVPGADYEVDLERCLTSAQTLDWIMHIAAKGWATDEVIAGLVRGIATVLNPQANLCSFGRSKSIAHTRVRVLVDRVARMSNDAA